MRNTISIAAIVFTVAATGCTSAPSADPDDDGVDQPDGTAKADGDAPQGIYDATTTVESGGVTSLTLSSDNTFSRTISTDCSGFSPDACGDFGTYEFSKSGSTHYIRFLFPNSSTLIDRMAYKVSGAKLSIRKTGETTFDVLENVASTKHLKAGAVCADAKGNLLGECPEDEPCQADDTTKKATQMCLPEI